MKKFFAVLLKKNLNLFLNNHKYASLYLYKRSQSKKGLAGRILRVSLNKHSTKFEVSDYVRQSKKHRSNVVDILVKDIFQYNFTGICIKQTKDQFALNTSFLIRNVFDQFPYELNVPLYSPLIDYIGVLFHRQKLKYLTHSKYYYLRSKPFPQSKTEFDYVVGVYDADFIEESDHYTLDTDIYRDLTNCFDDTSNDIQNF
jgi:ribosomal protein L19